MSFGSDPPIAPGYTRGSDPPIAPGYTRVRGCSGADFGEGHSALRATGGQAGRGKPTSEANMNKQHTLYTPIRSDSNPPNLHIVVGTVGAPTGPGEPYFFNADFWSPSRRQPC